MPWSEVKTSNYVQEIHCETADDLLEYLRPSHDRWLADNSQMGWIFRGHQRDDWKLEPSALRAYTPFFEPFDTELNQTVELFDLINDVMVGSHAPDSPIHRLFRHTACEKMAINEFVDAADDVGLAIPDDAFSWDFQLSNREFLKKLVNYVDLPSSWRDRIWDVARLHESYDYVPWYLQSDVVALAQHHGVPTRLLDWTLNPWKAAFFAANVDKERNGETPNIVVWAIRIAALVPAGLQYLKPRRSRIGYLRAQEGIFVYDVLQNKHFLKHGKWRTFEDAIREIEDPAPLLGLKPQDYWLRKVTLPTKCVLDLKTRLKAHGVERRFLMPTYDNVVKELEDRRLKF